MLITWRKLEPEARASEGPAAAPFVVTVSNNEAAGMLDGGVQVDSVPLPPAVKAWMEPFVKQHYKPEPRGKIRRRDPLADDDPTPGEGPPRQS